MHTQLSQPCPQHRFGNLKLTARRVVVPGEVPNLELRVVIVRHVLDIQVLRGSLTEHGFAAINGYHECMGSLSFRSSTPKKVQHLV